MYKYMNVGDMQVNLRWLTVFKWNQLSKWNGYVVRLICTWSENDLLSIMQTENII